MQININSLLNYTIESQGFSNLLDLFNNTALNELNIITKAKTILEKIQSIPDKDRIYSEVCSKLEKYNTMLELSEFKSSITIEMNKILKDFDMFSTLESINIYDLTIGLELQKKNEDLLIFLKKLKKSEYKKIINNEEDFIELEFLEFIKKTFFIPNEKIFLSISNNLNFPTM